MSARRARGRAKDSFGRDSSARGSPGRGRARGRGRGKVRADDESVELNPISAAPVSEAFDPSNLDRDEVTSEPNAINTKVNDPAIACIDKLQDTDATLETTLNSKESKIKTEKESDIINIVADAVSVAVNVTDNSRKRSKKEPVFIELDSDDDDEPAKANKERDLKSSNVDIKASYGLETLSNEQDVFDAGGDVINLDDDDDDDDDHETVKDEHHFYCTACDIDCKTKQGFENHAKGSYHCQRVKATDEDKGLRDEEEKQAVDTAAAAEAESDEVKDEEKMEIGIDADATEEAEEDAAESSQSWILLDQMHEEDEVALDAEADKIMAVAQDNASAAEVKEEPEAVACDASESSKEKTSSEGDELTNKERIQKDTCSVIDAKEGSDDIDAEEEVAADKSCVKKEADDDDVLFKKTDELDATRKEAIADTCYSVDDTDEETDKCDDMELDFSSENEELSESEQAELADNHEKNTDGDSGEAICKSTKEVNAGEANEQEEQHISDETEKAAAVKATGEQGDDDLARYYCAACNVQCDSDKTYHMHTRGMMHTLNCGSSSSAAERPAPVPQVYRVPKEKSKKSGAKKKSKRRKASGEGTADDVILIDADESDDAEDEEDSDDGDDVEEVEGSNNSKEYNWLENAADDPYYCDVCDCSMNSEQNYSSHLIGARHKKNMKSRDLGVPVKKPKGKVALGGRLSKVVNYEPKAQEMLNNCRDALIGLEYMTEFCHSSPDVEPRYVCNLCESRCDVRMVILHLTGLKHRINYLKKHHTNYAILVQQRSRKSDQTPLADEFAKEIEAAVGRRSMVVKLDMGIKEERRETGASVEPRKRRNSSSRRASATIDVPSVSPEERNRSGRQEAVVSRVRRRSRSDSRHRDRSPRRLSARQRTWSPSRDRQSIRRDYDRDRQSSRRSIERDRHDRDRDDYDRDDRDYRGSTSERKPRSDYSRYEQDSGRMKSLLSPALHVLYASGRRDSDRDRRSSRRSSERDRYDSDRGDRDDRDYRGSTSERRRRSDYSRHEQGSRTAPSLPSPAKALYAASTNYPYAQPAGVPYGLVSPAAFAMSSSYTAALGAAYSVAQRATVTVPPPPKRTRLSDPPSAAPVPMSYAPPPSALGLYGPLGAQAAYANLYGAHFLSPPPPQPVPPVMQQSPVMSISSTSYQKSLREHSSTVGGGVDSPVAYGTKPDRGSSSSRAAPSDNSYSTFSSIVASVASGTKDDDEAAAMSKVIAEAVIKYKMQKAQEKAKQPRPPDQYQRPY